MFTGEIDAYILSHIDEEGDLLSALNRDANVNLLRPRMLSGHLQGRILKMFCRMIRPRRVLEIGTYTSYATLCMAEGMEEGALIHTIEINDEMEDFIMKYLSRSLHKDKIKVHFGDAMEIIPRLDETFDMVFIDADKRLYSEYYDLVFPMVRPGGLILADNTLWDGKVVEEVHPSDKQTKGILVFNEKVKQDDRVEKVILPLRDGLTMIWKKEIIKRMESTRLQKIERLLQKELSDIFQKQTQGMHGVLVSVSVVRVSPDLSVARAYLSIFPSDKSQELLEAIRSNTKAIRFDLGQRIRLQVRKIPELSFFIDDSLDYIENIDNLLHK